MGNSLKKPVLVDLIHIGGNERYKVQRTCPCCRKNRFTDEQVEILKDENSTVQKIKDSIGTIDINPMICGHTKCVGKLFRANNGGWNNIDLGSYLSLKNLTPETGKLKDILLKQS